MNKRYMFLALLIVLFLSACDAETVAKVAAEEIASVTGHNLCAQACEDNGLELAKYVHGDDPDCWCRDAEGNDVLQW